MDESALILIALRELANPPSAFIERLWAAAKFRPPPTVSCFVSATVNLIAS
jgi:hypothetical protein